MDERAFRDRTTAIYKTVVARLDREDPDDIEAEYSSGVVRIKARDGSNYVLNHQVPLSEIWYAAGDRAWHYRYFPDTGLWIDPRNGDELGATLARTLSAISGRPLTFDLPR